MPVVADEDCSTCAEGAPLSSGVYADGAGGRVRWASWTCGHSWSSAATDVERKRDRSETLQKLLAATGFRRHAPVSTTAK